jgi:nucleoid-associated protein YgaU
MAAPALKGELQKLKFYNADTGQEVVECHFNPNEFTITKSNQWQAENKAGANIPDVHFKGGGPRQLQMTLIFDTYEKCTNGASVDVRQATDKLLALMEAEIPQKTPRGQSTRPPHVEVGWGKFRSFRGVITQLSQKFTLFMPDGVPVRATVQVTLQEVPKEAVKKQTKGQNPTSLAAGAREVHVVRPGDTIDWIAAERLGDPMLWRRIAEANGLDDPRRLRPGQLLLIPPEL